MTHSDTGTVIDAGTSALTVSGDGERSLLLPDFGDDEIISDAVLFLTAVFMRADMDDGFVQEQIEWFNALKG